MPCSHWIYIYITLYFNVSSTLLQKNRNTDFLYIYIYIYIYCYAKIIILEHFSLMWRMLLEAGGTVFIINSKYIWRKLTQRLISKQFCIILVLIHSRVQWRMDVWSWNQPLIGSIRHSDRQGKNQLTIGMPQWNKNSKVQILGKSKPFPVKSRSEMHFWIKHESAPKHLHSHLK